MTRTIGDKKFEKISYMFSFLAEWIAQKSEHKIRSLMLTEFGGKGEREENRLNSIPNLNFVGVKG